MGRAPLKDPVEIKLKGYNLTLRNNEADRILVQAAGGIGMSAEKITIALAGNPNSGKTSMFNAITGARQHVGNYPGVTVEKKWGHVSLEQP